MIITMGFMLHHPCRSQLLCMEYMEVQVGQELVLIHKLIKIIIGSNKTPWRLRLYLQSDYLPTLKKFKKPSKTL